MKEYLANAWIRRHETSHEEIGDLLTVVERDLRDSDTPNLSPEWRFDIAYNAVLQSATAALAAKGFRAERTNKHMRTLETLAFTLGLDADDVAYVDVCRRKRHVAVHERVGAIADTEAKELLAFARNLHRRLLVWLDRETPHLLGKDA